MQFHYNKLSSFLFISARDLTGIEKNCLYVGHYRMDLTGWCSVTYMSVSN